LDAYNGAATANPGKDFSMKIRALFRLAPAVLLIAALAAPLFAAIDGPQKTLPIMTWLGPGKDLLRPDIFKKVAEAGFSVNMSFLGDRESNLKALDLARDAGLTLMIYDDRLAKLVEDASLPLAPLDQVVADYRNHPALYGYYVLDEPNASKFPRLGEIVRYLAAKDPLHPAYINLFPTYANSQQLGTETYEQHVAAYMKTVQPAFLSYDHYPITDKGLRPDYYRNLEIIRGAAAAGAPGFARGSASAVLDRGLEPRASTAGPAVPFWAFTLSVPHAVYLPPTLGRLRLQLFSDIAYGAQGLQYFTYATPTGNDYDWKPALIDAQGRPTPSHDLARQVNAEIRVIESLVLRWKSEAVFHSEPLPDGTLPLPPGGPVRSFKNAPAVIGMFKDGPDEYVMIVHRDYENAGLAVAEFDPVIVGLVEIAKDAASPASIRWAQDSPSRTAAFFLNPGDARIFKIVR